MNDDYKLLIAAHIMTGPTIASSLGRPHPSSHQPIGISLTTILTLRKVRKLCWNGGGKRTYNWDACKFVYCTGVVIC